MSSPIEGHADQAVSPVVVHDDVQAVSPVVVVNVQAGNDAVEPQAQAASEADDAVTTSYHSAEWRKSFEDATTVEDANAVSETVRTSVLVWNRKLQPSGNETALRVCIPTAVAVPAKDTSASALNIKQLFFAGKTPVTPVFDGVVAVDAKEEAAIRNLAGPLPSGARVFSAAVVREEARVRITHAVFFLADGKNTDAFTYGFVELRNGIPDIHTAMLVCGKESPTRQTDACATAAAESASHFTAQFEGADGPAKTLAGWWVATVNGYVTSACSLPSEPVANRLTATLTERMDAYRLWSMRMCLCAKLHKAALNRINNVVVEPKKRRSKAKPASNKPKAATANAGQKATKKRAAPKAAVVDDDDEDDDEDSGDDEGGAGPSRRRGGGGGKRLRANVEADDDDDEDEDNDVSRQVNADNYYGLTDIRQCGTVFMPTRSGDGPLYTREQIDDCLKDATQMFLYAACTGQKVSIVLGDSKKTTRVFDTFSRRA